MQMADGYPIEAEHGGQDRAGTKSSSSSGPTRRRVFLPHAGEAREAPARRRDLPPAGSRGDVAQAGGGEQQALAAGKSRKEAIHAAYDRSTEATSRRNSSRRRSEQGGLHTTEDLASWKVHDRRAACTTTYKGIEVYKLTHWTQGPVLLQALNILENVDLKSMGYNSAATSTRSTRR